MVGRIKTEIKQQGEFKSVSEELALNIFRTSDHMMSQITELLKPASLTVTQYNALRILRGAKETGHMCSEVGARMITKESDVTRLLDRLEARGLIERERPSDNRRVVIAKITKEGLDLIAPLDEPLSALHLEMVNGLSEQEQAELITMLETIRGSA